MLNFIYTAAVVNSTLKQGPVYVSFPSRPEVSTVDSTEEVREPRPHVWLRPALGMPA